jgi:polyketide synthase PksN
MGGVRETVRRKLVDSIRDAFSSKENAQARTRQSTDVRSKVATRSGTKNDIAVVGMACRFPGANNYGEYWHLLLNGVNAIKEIPPSRWDVNEFYSPDIDAPNKSISKWCGLVDGIDKFDNRFFNISPREAKSMDPQQRLLLEEAWHCIEDSGVALSRLQEKKTSVYIGVMAIDYYGESSQSNQTDSYACLGNYECILANRLSYYFGLSGASISIDAACASSLIALHEAKTSLRSGECDYALAGGVSLNFHPFKYISFSKSRMLSPDGQCRTFSADANGYVPGDGVGVLLLQRLSDAERDGNHIYGVIKGSAMNHTGPALSITAPRMEAQRDVVLGALQDSGMSPETVSYVEAHGTGTSLGDPIEVESLTNAFREHTDKRRYCRIGSVKSNIGHLEAAAGVAGVIKVLLMMRNRKVPRTLNVTELNPIIDFDETPFEVALDVGNWEPADGVDLLRAGVSSFGFGGANSHVLIEEYRVQVAPVDEAHASENPFVLSARTTRSMEGLISEWKTFVESEEFKGRSLRDICLTTLTGRASFPFRVGIVPSSKEALAEFVSGLDKVVSVDGSKPLCLGIGNIPLDGFARIEQLYQHVPPFSDRVDGVLGVLARQGGGRGVRNGFKKRAWGKKRQALYAFVATYAIVKTYIESGVVPDVVTGSGAGALVSLVITGIVSLEDALLHLCGRKKIDAVEFNRPRLSFYDAVHGEILNPYHLDEAYVRDLLENMDTGEEALVGQILVEEIAHASGELPGRGGTLLGKLLVRRNVITLQQLEEALIAKSGTGQLLGSILVEKGSCTLRQIEEALSQQDQLRNFVEKAKLLEQSQFTFKKYLAEWDEALGKFGRRVRDFLDDEDLLRSTGRTRFHERLLLQVIILSSLRRLQQKWSLADKALMPDPRFNELIDLLLDKVLPEDQLVRLLLAERPDYHACAELLDARQNLMKVDRPYSIARSHNRGLAAVGHKVEWLEGLEHADLCIAEGYLGFVLDSQENLKADVQAIFSEEVGRAFKVSLFDLWLKGVNVAWNVLYPEGSFRKIAMPTYVFEPKSFWIEGHASAGMARWLPDEGAPKPLCGDRIRFSREFRREDPIVQDHVITGKHLIPGASMIALGLYAAERLADRPLHMLRGVAVQRPGIVETALTLDVEADMSGRSFLVLDGPDCLTRGKFDEAEFLPLPPIDIQALKKGRSLRVDEIYARFMQSGYHYGEGLHVIKAGWQSGDRYLFEVSDTSGDASVQGRLNPRLLDGLFQSVLAVEVLNDKLERQGQLFVPYLLRSINFDGVQRDAYYAYVDLNRIDDRSGDLLVSFGAYGEDGRSVISIDKMVFKKVENQFVMHAGSAISRKTASETTHYYKPIWRRVDNDVPSFCVDCDKRHALLLSDGSPFAECIYEHLKKEHQAVWLIERGEAFELTERGFVLNHKQEDDFVRLVDDLLQGSNDHLSGIDVFYLWSDKLVSFSYAPIDVGTIGDYGIQPAFYLMKSLMKVSIPGGVRFVACTKNAQAIAVEDAAKSFVFGSLTGFLKTLALESSRVRTKVVDFPEAGMPDADMARALVMEVACQNRFESVGYREGERYVQVLESCELLAQGQEVAWKEGGVYLLAGGVGGVGKHVARSMAAARARIAFIGRSALNDEKQRFIESLRRLGADVEYYRSDITDTDAMRQVVYRVKEKWGPIHGVIQASGVLEDKLFVNKDWASFERVMVPKVDGTLVLNEVTREEPLDFFVVFSSVVSILGNVGQSDYAAANSFLDAFTGYRSRAHYPGKSISVNWTLWSDGGMGIDDRTRSQFQGSSGLINSAQGMEALKSILQNDEPQVIVAGRKMLPSSRRLVEPVKKFQKDLPKQQKLVHDDVAVTVGSALKDVLSGILHIEPADLDNDTDLKEFGVDSVAIMDVVDQMETRFGYPLNHSDILEHPTIQGLVGCILKRQNVSRDVEGGAEVRMPEDGDGDGSQEHVEGVIREILSSILHMSPEDLDGDVDIKEFGTDSVAIMDLIETLERRLGDVLTHSDVLEHPTIQMMAECYVRKSGMTKAPGVSVESEHHVPSSTAGARGPQPKKIFDISSSSMPSTSAAIAVIAMAGRFPRSSTVEEFWEHLRTGDSLITEVPKDRFDIDRFFSPEKDAPGKSYSRWGGFLDDIYQFDADHFNVSVADAMGMDPQQRVILELSQELLDRAGYQADELSKTATGVVIGGMESRYVVKHLNAFMPNTMKHLVINRIQNMIAARISNHYNLNGVAYTIDTACSSSLVAIHNACTSLRTRESDVVIAGGVDLIVDEIDFIGFSKGRALSSGPLPRVFDEKADGFILAEGAGLVLLKRLDDAIADGDEILAIIKGSAVNNDGNTMGVTTPNPDAQRDVVERALQNANVHPETINFYEAHGTGTSLGDPIEMKAATELFRQYTDKTQYCALGSVKSNMGHSLRSAGVASFIKVLLSLKHHEIPATLNCKTPHPRYRFSESPFYPNMELQSWNPPSGLCRAGISSFGFGGTNCHVILDEFKSGDHSSYHHRRNALPMTQWRRRKYRIDEVLETVVSNPQQRQSDRYAAIIAKVKRGELTPDEAVRLTGR